MPSHTIATREAWIAARKQLLEREKAMSRQRDELAAERRKLPWVKIDKDYAFETPRGRASLRDLFAGRRQLLVYHLMFDPTWDEACKSCSFVVDHIEGALVHLHARDVTYVAISRAPLEKIDTFKKRMGWRFPWVSSFGTDFNYDFHVSFHPEDVASGDAQYNYRPGTSKSEAPGLSTFVREGGDVFHTYSTYARGLDTLIGTYQYLDLAPLGRDEDDLPYGMAWVRHHDRYA